MTNPAAIPRAGWGARLLLAAGLGLLGWYVLNLQGIVFGDAFIIYRYADHLAHGQGLVFNVGEMPRAEGVTSPLWALVLALGIGGGIDPVITAKVLGVLFTAGTGVLVYRWVCEEWAGGDGESGLSRHRGRLIAALAVLVLWSDPTLAAHALTGMETAMGTCLLTLFLYRLTRPSVSVGPARAGLLTAWVAVAAALVRPELSLAIAAGYIAAFAVFRDLRRSIGRSAAWFVGIGTVYFLARMRYYDMFLPLPYYVKQAVPGWFRSWPIVKMFLDTWEYFWIWLPVLWWGLARPNPFRRVLIILTAVFVIQTAYYTTIAHYMGNGFRYLQPLVPLLITLVALSCGVLLTLRISRRLRRWILLVPLLSTMLLLYNRWHKLDNMQAGFLNERANQTVWLGRALHRVDPSGARHFAATDVGATAYYSRWRVTDLFGLNNRNIARDATAQTVLAEVERGRPDLLILFSHRRDAYQGLPLEARLYARAEGLGYERLGTLRLDDTYYYWIYGERGASHTDLMRVLSTTPDWFPARDGL